MMLAISLVISLSILAVALVLCGYRVLTGPSIPDRVLGLDAMTLNLMAAIILISIGISRVYYNAVLIIAILSLIASVSVAKYLVQGRVIDHDSDGD